MGSSPLKRSRSTFVILAATVVLATACSETTPNSGSQTSTATPTSSAPTAADTTASVDYAKAIRTIEIDGTAETPIHWRLPQKSDQGTAHAVRAAQRWQALYYQAKSSHHPERLLALASAVATPLGERILRHRVKVVDHRFETGPVWIWVHDPERDSDNAAMQICVDEGWNTSPGEHDQRPERRYFRSTSFSFYLSPVDHDGKTRWKVARVTQGRDSFEQDCDAWATHRPKNR